MAHIKKDPDETTALDLLYKASRQALMTADEHEECRWAGDKLSKAVNQLMMFRVKDQKDRETIVSLRQEIAALKGQLVESVHAPELPEESAAEQSNAEESAKEPVPAVPEPPPTHTPVQPTPASGPPQTQPTPHPAAPTPHVPSTGQTTPAPPRRG